MMAGQPRRTVPALALALLVLGGCAGPGASTRFDSTDSASASIQATVQRFRERAPQTARYFDEAYGYAVFPSVGRVAAIFGLAYGRGVLVEGSGAVGDVQVWHGLHGITFGGELYSEILFFQDADTLRAFQAGNLEFRGRAGIAAGPAGHSADPAFNNGVAVFTMTRGGLMLDISVAGTLYRYVPIQGVDQTARSGARPW
jgi:lipid-binding SYLF domain-containing protein